MLRIAYSFISYADLSIVRSAVGEFAYAGYVNRFFGGQIGRKLFELFGTSGGRAVSGSPAEIGPQVDHFIMIHLFKSGTVSHPSSLDRYLLPSRASFKRSIMGCFGRVSFLFNGRSGPQK